MATLRRVVVAAALSLVGASPCAAEWIVGAYAGAIHTRPTEIRIEHPLTRTALDFPDVSFRSRSLTPPIYYGYRVAHSLPGGRWLFIEGELIHGKLYVRDPSRTEGAGTLFGDPAARLSFSDVVQRFALSHGLNFVLANALVRVPLRGERLTATARAGAGVLLPHAEIEILRERTEEYQLAGPAFQIGAGIELRVRGRLRALTEYKWSYARPRIEFDDGGDAQLATRSHHIAFGIGATF